ncbi:pyridoxal-phosphate dependent enzyme [Epidermidibacterium keratini]|uniref:Pyridoxal-phosphate dependent enzyme n=1 Tax=Epidermidibacterium keratini TaxID=1891644 RepID=A0A7L4YJB6_9ACTN|nr:pyridoxal-phosphate dependent enzyme [Epidermidibacterium keratini]
MPHSRSHESPTTTDLSLANITAARDVIPQLFQASPQFQAETLNGVLGAEVTLKVETANPLRSFKGRGVSYALRDVVAGEQVVCASSGNFGAAVAYAGRSRGARVTVYAPSPLNPVKRDRMIAFGAEIIAVPEGASHARQLAVEAADAQGARLIVDGVDPAIAEGAGTIAVELCALGDRFDAVVVPIGDGSLIGGIGRWFKAHSPSTRIIGVNPQTAPAMHDSYRAGAPQQIVRSSAFAEGISIPTPHPEALSRVISLVNDIVLVTDDQLRHGIGLIADHLSIIAEPAGAAGIAAIASGAVPGRSIATIITGANPNPSDSGPT